MNYEHVAHIIRDVFHPENSVICYGEEEALALKSTLHSAEHGIEAFVLHSNPEKKDDGMYWMLPGRDSFYGFDFCKLFISLGYSSELEDLEHDIIPYSIKIASLMKPGGIVLLVNPSKEYTLLIDMLTKRPDLVNKVKSYSEFADQQVWVLER